MDSGGSEVVKGPYLAIMEEWRPPWQTGPDADNWSLDSCRQCRHAELCVAEGLLAWTGVGNQALALELKGWPATDWPYRSGWQLLNKHARASVDGVD